MAEQLTWLTLLDTELKRDRVLKHLALASKCITAHCHKDPFLPCVSKRVEQDILVNSFNIIDRIYTTDTH